jgi:AcrR family transcriptional regulator
MRLSLGRWNNSLQTNEEVYRLKRRAIVSESGRIFGKQGFHNTSLDDVAKVLKVARGTLYNYVKDKQEILFECHKMALDISDWAHQLAEEQGGTAIVRLRNELYQYTVTLTEEFGFCGILAELESLRPEDRKVIIARRDDVERRFVETLKQGIAEGSVRDVDPKLAVCTFVGAINNIALWYSPDGRLSNIEIADKMVDILLGGLATNASVDLHKTKKAPFLASRTTIPGKTRREPRARRPQS